MAILKGIYKPFRYTRGITATIEHLGPTISAIPVGLAAQVTKVMKYHEAAILESHQLIVLDSFRRLLLRLKLVKVTHRRHELVVTRHPS